MTEDVYAPTLHIQGAIATLQLNKAAYANRLSPANLKTIERHIATVNEREEVLVLRLRASGRYFCSGYDISSLASDEAPSSLYFGEVVDSLEDCRAITIAAIQGGVYGGGTDLCLACDFRVGTDLANMFMPAVKFGLHFYPGGMRRYISRLGLNNAKYLFLTGEKIEAARMLDMGFLTELVPEQHLLSRTDELSSSLAAMAPQALLGIKKHLNLIVRNDIRTEEITQAVLLSERSEDMKEGAAAWKAQRKPVFTGR
ncbi:enoyl-CoA hydratase/isomerase family protein [Advenella mimigardefordensis]|uniref:Putative enoyl-CoA hydratase/isomerase n=1 Tax=Advenella mimigardefordensis (strain DSM 17166 / LMG 22922 / DPN7) TaxID=1247726 RepID=W0P7U1_ADVMD|nr:enoyl-CoA hydratase/isomerase family protein [Advenella mimigardefordensis]AHG62924.1 putative enoyl-CoA hydratase/isomerase [Advenella mimigardefordensis DPN7]